MAIDVGYMALVKGYLSCYDTNRLVSKGLWTFGGLVVANANEDNAIILGRHFFCARHGTSQPPYIFNTYLPTA